MNAFENKKTYRRMQISGLVLVLLLTASVCKAWRTYHQICDTAEIKGEFWTNSKDDTLTLRYQFTPDRFNSDSVILKVYGTYGDNIKFDVNNYGDSSGEVIIYERAEGVPFSNDWRQVEYRNGRLLLTGKVRIPLLKQNTALWVLSVSGYYTDENDSVQVVNSNEYMDDRLWGLGMEIWLPSYGYFKSDLDVPLNRKSIFLGWGMSMELLIRHMRYMLSTSWSGLGNNFSFSEPFRAGVRYYSGSRSNWLPQLYSAFKLTKLKVCADDIQHRKVVWGGEFGIAFEGAFERLGYHYSTALDGYHTAELFLCNVSGVRTKIGTRYVFQTGGDVWIIRVSFHTEGWRSLAGGRYFRRINDRPLIHKILCWPGIIPSAAIFGIFHVLGLEKWNY
jgi:hypothetical protein